MSMDTMQAHDDGIEEARKAVREELAKHFTVECQCRECHEWKRAQQRIMTALTKLKETR